MDSESDCDEICSYYEQKSKKSYKKGKSQNRMRERNYSPWFYASSNLARRELSKECIEDYCVDDFKHNKLKIKKKCGY